MDMRMLDVTEPLVRNDTVSQPIIEFISMEAGQTGQKLATGTEIVFVLEGCIHVDMHAETHIQAVAVKGDFLFVPVGMPLHYTARNGCLVMLMTVPDLSLCKGLDTGRLYDMKKDGKEQAACLEMNGEIWELVSTLSRVVKGKVLCRQYFEIKVQEFLLLLRVFYTKEQLQAFFYYALSPDMAFSDFIRTNRLKYNTVQEMSDAMHLSVRHFTKKFKRVFSISPGQWMLRQKAYDILEDIQAGQKTLQQIAADYNFSAVSNFNRFCKKTFGASPGEIRSKTTVL